MLFNASYRPDLMGCEQVWKKAKHQYKQLIANMKVNRLPIDNYEVVKASLAAVSNDDAKKIAARGWKSLTTQRQELIISTASSPVKLKSRRKRSDLSWESLRHRF